MWKILEQKAEPLEKWLNEAETVLAEENEAVPNLIAHHNVIMYIYILKVI